MYDCSELHFIPMTDVIHQLVNGQTSKDLNIQDRGLSYGHGVFETLKISAGQAVLWREHLDRLVTSCQRLKISTDHLQTDLESDLLKLPVQEQAVLKIIITAGVGGRGYQVPEKATPTRIVQIFPYPVYSDQPEQLGIKARWCQIQLSSAPLLAGMKHLNRLEQVLARSEWSDASIKEGIVCGCDGFLAEGTMSNLFLIKNGVLKTPILHSYGVEGIMRNYLLDLAKANAIPVEVTQLTKADLLSADEVFFCNSLIEIWPLRQLEEHCFEIGPITRKLQSLLKAESL
ncbi:MAG: aminodeoxychorismate lyase [Nitrincola sp.]|nr:aminodeoxychorismate lyase [Nitrincola sp.]